MKLNKQCPAFKLCEDNNIKVGDLWGRECPRGLKSGKRDFTQCDEYQKWERDDAIPKRERTTKEHPESVQR